SQRWRCRRRSTRTPTTGCRRSASRRRRRSTTHSGPCARSFPRSASSRRQLAQVPEVTPAPRPGPGRPPSGADERIVQAALDVLETDGYAGLTTAKVAARSGHNKALIAYHFGSKQGLVAEVSRRVGAQFSNELLSEIGTPTTIEQLARELVDATW